MLKSAVPAEPKALPGNASLGYLDLTNERPEAWCAAVEYRSQVIGRSQRCDIVLPQRFVNVSRRHAEIYADRAGIWIRDLDSRHGTHVNGVWIEKHQQASLATGDRIWMGGAEIRLVAELAMAEQLMVGSDGSCNTNGGRPPDVIPTQVQAAFAELSQAEITDSEENMRAVLREGH